jgi:hypothetical protein
VAPIYSDIGPVTSTILVTGFEVVLSLSCLMRPRGSGAGQRFAFFLFIRCVFLGSGFHYRPSSGARPPKSHGPASRRPRPSAESAPISQPLYCLSTRPKSPPHPAPQLLSPPSPPPSPEPLACDLQLASVAVSAARRDSASSHPGRAHFSLPKEDLRLRPPHRSPPALPHVEHLNPDCRLAVFDEISMRHLIRPSFRRASKARSASRPGPPISPNADQRPAA